MSGQVRQRPGAPAAPSRSDQRGDPGNAGKGCSAGGSKPHLVQGRGQNVVCKSALFAPGLLVFLGSADYLTSKRGKSAWELKETTSCVAAIRAAQNEGSSCQLRALIQHGPVRPVPPRPGYGRPPERPVN